MNLIVEVRWRLPTNFSITHSTSFTCDNVRTDAGRLILETEDQSDFVYAPDAWIGFSVDHVE